MAQLYHNDSNMMIHQGKTAAEYSDPVVWPDYNPVTQTIVNSAQSFPDDWDRFAWTYMPSLSRYYRTTNKRHAYMRAAKGTFTNARWEEVEDKLEELGQFNRYFAEMNFQKIRRKFARAENLGIITALERSELVGLLP